MAIAAPGTISAAVVADLAEAAAVVVSAVLAVVVLAVAGPEEAGRGRNDQ